MIFEYGFICVAIAFIALGLLLVYAIFSINDLKDHD